MEPLPKRPRVEFDGAGPYPAFLEQRNAYGGGGGGRFLGVFSEGREVWQQPTSTGKPKPCMKFFSTSGCQFGESCHFLHYVPGGLSSLVLTPAVSHSAASASVSQKKASTTSGGDPSVTVSGYKTKLCNRFNTAEGCRFGDRCHFAHGEGDLRLTNNASRLNRRPVGNGSSGAATGFSSGGSNFPHPMGYPTPPGNPSTFISQGYLQPNQPAVATNNAFPAAYPSGRVTGNTPVHL